MGLFGKRGAYTGQTYSTPDRWEGSRAYYQQMVDSGAQAGGEGGGPSYGEVVAAQQFLSLMDQAGVNHISEVPGYERHERENDDNSLFQQVASFATNPAVLTAAGGVAGVMAGGAGAAAAAGGEYGAGYGVGNAATAGAGAGAGSAVGAGAAAGAGGAYSPLAMDVPLAGGAGAAAGAGGVAAGAGTGAGTTAAGTTALSRLLSGNGTADDWAQLVGTGVDAYGAYQQRNDAKEIADRSFAMGAPYRDELTRISADPNAFYTSPTATKATEAVLQRLSSQYGNPAGNPYAQSLTIDALYDEYGSERDRLAGYGGLTSYTTAGNSTALDAAGANANLYNTIGGGIAELGTPKKQSSTLADYLEAYKRLGGTV